MKLEPCPFCGGEASISYGKQGDGTPWPYIECGDCSAMVGGSDDTEAGAIIAWNTRYKPREERNGFLDMM